jgi:hypothetical protein
LSDVVLPAIQDRANPGEANEDVIAAEEGGQRGGKDDHRLQGRWPVRLRGRDLEHEQYRHVDEVEPVRRIREIAKPRDGAFQYPEEDPDDAKNE